MVYYCMTVRTHRPEVSDGVHFVIFADFRKLEYVVNMDKSFQGLSVGHAERETTDVAIGPIFLDAHLTSQGVALIAVN